ncbi:hypothetical protein Tco_1505264 [Tanacetum coccineum]
MSGKTDSLKLNNIPGCLPGSTFVYSEVFKLDFSSASHFIPSHVWKLEGEWMWFLMVHLEELRDVGGMIVRRRSGGDNSSQIFYKYLSIEDLWWSMIFLEGLDDEALVEFMNLSGKTTRASSTNSFKTVSTPVNAAGAPRTSNDVGPSFVPLGRSFLDDPLMPDLVDTAKVQNTGIFGCAYDDDNLDTYNSPYADQVMGVEADFNNMEPSTVTVGLIELIYIMTYDIRDGVEDLWRSIKQRFARDTLEALPAGTPPLLPIPLPAPSTSRRADIPEAETPPQKRILLTAPTPRVEVGESSDAAAARQLGSTMACRVDHSFVDTVDTKVRDTERRTMAAVEVVNLRAYRHEWQRQDADDRAIEHIIRTQALEAGARIDTLEDTGSSA